MAATAQETVSAVVSERRFDTIAVLLDTLELESANPNVLADDSWPHALHLLGHIYNQDLSDARFLWRRIPATIKQNKPELQAVWMILKYSWHRHYQGIWQALQGYPWSTQLQPVIEALSIKQREHLISLISTAYATVTPSKVAMLCGLTEREALSVCQGQGWQYDSDSQMILVSPKAPAATRKQDGLTNLQQLSEYTIHLES